MIFVSQANQFLLMISMSPAIQFLLMIYVTSDPVFTNDFLW
jgi:hypothetical protein